MSLLHEIRTQNQLGDIKAELEEQNRLIRERQKQLSQLDDQDYDLDAEWRYENRNKIVPPALEQTMTWQVKEFAKTTKDMKLVKKYINSLRKSINNDWIPYLGKAPISRQFAKQLKNTICVGDLEPKKNKKNSK